MLPTKGHSVPSADWFKVGKAILSNKHQESGASRVLTSLRWLLSNQCGEACHGIKARCLTTEVSQCNMRAPGYLACHLATVDKIAKVDHH
eukprot:5694288-Amphidinium_carterae.1